MAPALDDDKTSLCVPFVLERLAAHRAAHPGAPPPPLLVGLNGVQGVGKTTLAAALAAALGARGVAVLVCSIDDFYLRRDEQAALAAAHPGNALVQHRGQPGTHDMALAAAVLAALARGEPTRVPRYDKAAFGGRGDRLPPAAWTPANQPGDAPLHVVVVEGWCVGFRALPPVAVADRQRAPSRSLAAHRLEHLLLVNEALGRDYDGALTDRLDAFIYIDAEDLGCVYAWRQEQEEALRAQRADPGAGMTPEQVVRFVDGYLPGYEMYADGVRAGVLLPARPGCQLSMVVDRDRRVKQVVCI